MMDFSHYIMHTIQHIIKCEQDIMTIMNQMFLFLTIRQLLRSILNGVTALQCVQNVTNMLYVNICGTVKSLARFLQCNGGKVKQKV